MRRRALAALAALIYAAAVPAAEFRDPEDGWFDLSEFLETAYGFVPLAVPITEPAVGYGLAAAAVFIKRQPPVAGQPHARPNIGALGGLATDNGSRGLFAGHSGNWREGRLRSLAGLADMDLNLEFYGVDPGRFERLSAVDYTIRATGGVLGGSHQVGQTPLWLGLNYVYAATELSLRGDPGEGAELPPTADFGLNLGGLTPSLTIDLRNNFFTPTRGWYLDLTVPLFREGLGSDRDFEKATLTGLWFKPLSDALFFGVKGAVKYSSDGTPFYLRPFVQLRGVEALRYQGEEAAEVEAELRWQFHPRFSLVGFAGAGRSQTKVRDRSLDENVTSGGVGFRYLVARRLGLNMGLDVAFGPDDPIFYVVFGSAWLRP